MSKIKFEQCLKEHINFNQLPYVISSMKVRKFKLSEIQYSVFDEQIQGEIHISKSYVKRISLYKPAQ